MINYDSPRSKNLKSETHAKLTSRQCSPGPFARLLPALGEAGHNEEGGGIEKYVVDDGLDKVGGRVDGEEGDKVCRVVGQ